jgi:exonuclease VII large subunit
VGPLGGVLAGLVTARGGELEELFSVTRSTVYRAIARSRVPLGAVAAVGDHGRR